MSEIFNGKLEQSKIENKKSESNPQYSILKGAIEAKAEKTTKSEVLLDTEKDLKSLKEIQEKTKENLENLKIINEIRTKILKDFSKVEGFEKGMSFLLSQDVNVLRQIQSIFDGIVKTNKQNEIIDFFEEESFFSDIKTLNRFIDNYYSRYSNKSDSKELKSADEIIKKGITLNEIHTKYKDNPIFQKTLNDFKLKYPKFDEKDFVEGFQKLDNNQQKEFALDLLTQIQKESIKETNPEKRKELENLFTSVSTDFVSAGIFTYGEIDLLKRNLEKDINISESRLKPEGYKSYDNGNTLIKNEKGTNEIITFDSSGKPSEKIASSNSGYEFKLDSSIPLLRDIAIIESKINKVKGELNWAINNYQDILRNSGLLISLKPEYILQVLAKNPQDITQEKEREIYKELKGSEKIIKELSEIIKTLETKLKNFKDRKTEYEKEKDKNKEKFEDLNKQKEIVKNKIQILDSIGITQLQQNYVDEMINYLQTDDVEKITGIKIDFSTNAKENTKTNLKNILSILFGKNKNEVFENGTDKLIPPYNKQNYIREIEFTRKPEIIINGIFSQKGLETRLKQKTENSPKN